MADPEAVLRFQNEKLVAHVEFLKGESRDLESQVSTLKKKAAAYDNNISRLSRCWNQLVDDLKVVAARANCGQAMLPDARSAPSGAAPDITPTNAQAGRLFLQRLTASVGARDQSNTQPRGADCAVVKTENGDNDKDNGSAHGDDAAEQLEAVRVEAALVAKRGDTAALLETVLAAIDAQRRRNDALAAALEQHSRDGGGLAPAVLAELQATRAELATTRGLADELQARHAGMAAELSAYQDSHTRNLCRIGQLQDELQTMTYDLEVTRRRLATAKSSGPLVPRPNHVPLGLKDGSGSSACGAIGVGDAAPRTAKLEDGKGGDEPLVRNGSGVVGPSGSVVTDDRGNDSRGAGDGYGGAAGSAAVAAAVRAESSELKNKLAEAREELGHAQMLADSRLKELEAFHESTLRLEEEKRGLEEKLRSDAHVVNSRLFLALQNQVMQMAQDLEKYRLAVEELQRERHTLALQEREDKVKADVAAVARRLGEMAEQRAREADASMAALRQERDELVLKLEQAKLAEGRGETVSELKVMVATLQKKGKLLQGELAAATKEVAKLESCRVKASEMAAAVDAKVRKLEEAERRLAAQAARVEELEQQAAVLRERECDMRAFVEVMRSVADVPADIAAARTAEVRATKEAEDLRRRLGEHPLRLKAQKAEAAEAAARKELEAAQAETERVRADLGAAQREAAELKAAMRSKAEEGESYMNEIEVIGAAYEDMQAQNARLLQQLIEREECNTTLLSERIRARQQHQMLSDDNEALRRQLADSEAGAELLKGAIRQMEAHIKDLTEQLNKVSDEARSFQSAMEVQKRAVRDSGMAAAEARAALEAERRSLEEKARQHAESAIELDKERFKRKRMEESLAIVTEKAKWMQDKAGNAGVHGAGVEELTEQIKGVRHKLRIGGVGRDEDIIWGLIGANCAVFAAVNLHFIGWPTFLRHFTVSAQNLQGLRLHTLVTHAFTHADIWHLGSNMLALYFFGSEMVGILGPSGFLKLYLGAGAVAGLAHVVYHSLYVPWSKGYPRAISDPAALGASGAVNAVVLLNTLMFPTRIIYLNFFIPVPAILLAGLYLYRDLEGLFQPVCWHTNAISMLYAGTDTMS
eukprot:jgi/Mesvir1/1059/Mv17580-RA.1